MNKREEADGHMWLHKKMALSKRNKRLKLLIRIAMGIAIVAAIGLWIAKR
jgi:cytoskeletal protein RodZ